MTAIFFIDIDEWGIQENLKVVCFVRNLQKLKDICFNELYFIVLKGQLQKSFCITNSRFIGLHGLVHFDFASKLSRKRFLFIVGT